MIAPVRDLQSFSILLKPMKFRYPVTNCDHKPLALFLLRMAELAISTSASSGGSEHEMNLIAIVYCSCQTFSTNALLVDQNLDMRIQPP